jgi:peptidoglycan DL-endopeptidase CwlO
MSISSVMDRIQQIQTQIDQLQSYQAGDTATGQAFATTLDRVSATSSGSATSAASSASSSSPVSSLSSAADLSGAAPTTSQQAVVDEAKKYLGLPYVWGGTSITSGVDCSGLVQSVYKSLGYDLPRLSADQARCGRPIPSMADAQPGDLIAWDNSSRNNGADHIAIYVGNGKMIEAAHTGTNVRLVDVPSTPDYIRRILPDSVDARAVSSSSLAASRASFDLQSLRSVDQEGAA